MATDNTGNPNEKAKHPLLRAGFPRLSLGLALSLSALTSGAQATLLATPFSEDEQTAREKSECPPLREFVCATCGHFLEPELFDENEQARGVDCETGKAPVPKQPDTEKSGAEKSTR